MVVIISITAIFLGLLVPSVTRFMHELLNNRVITIDDIANYPNTPPKRKKAAFKILLILFNS